MEVTLLNSHGDVLWTGTQVAAVDVTEESSGRPPILVAIEPAAVRLGSPDVTLHCYGTGFATGAVIVWNGAPEPTTRVSSRELTTGINMATAQVVMTLPIAVRNPDGGESSALAFRFDPPA